MNERIEAIAKEAGIHLDYFGLGSCLDGGNPDIGLFAKLLVQECATVCLDPNNWYEDAAGERYSKVIKEHFGVEP